MTDAKTLNLLVVEDDLEDEQLLCEALIEIEENRKWCNWRSADIVQVDQLADALDCLRRQTFDAVLLNLSLPDSPALLDSFLEAKACACGAPIIVLADEEDENLANRLIREGAEDVVQKRELECGPLARSIRYGIERRRSNQGARTPSMADSGTGALSCQAFTTAAYHYAQLAFSQNIELHLATLDVQNIPEKTPEEREACELFLMRAAEVLQETIPSPALVGRAGRSRFAIVLAGMTTEQAEAQVARAASEIEELLNALVGATTRFSVVQLNAIDGIDDLLNDSSLQEPRRSAKPVMLAD